MSASWRGLGTAFWRTDILILHIEFSRKNGNIITGSAVSKKWILAMEPFEHRWRRATANAGVASAESLPFGHQGRANGEDIESALDTARALLDQWIIGGETEESHTGYGSSASQFVSHDVGARPNLLSDVDAVLSKMRNIDIPLGQIELGLPNRQQASSVKPVKPAKPRQRRSDAAAKQRERARKAEERRHEMEQRKVCVTIAVKQGQWRCVIVAVVDNT